MVSFREFLQAFREVGITSDHPVIVHASLSSVGEIRGRADTVVGALLAATQRVIAPTFTYKTMIIPEVGPEDNACAYGTGKDQNRMAEFFHADMPADSMMGVLPELIRKHHRARRSLHPILSFAGIGVDPILAAQTLDAPLAPIGELAEENGMVLLLGVNHTANTSIHYAEYLAGRKQFVRWALTPQGVRECPGFSGCSDGFEAAAVHLEGITRMATIGGATLRALPLKPMIQILTDLIRQDPLALLCGKNDERCESVRRAVGAAHASSLSMEPM
jgi:aminoglycoside 3-N-acetyltransferase